MNWTEAIFVIKVSSQYYIVKFIYFGSYNFRYLWDFSLQSFCETCTSLKVLKSVFIPIYTNIILSFGAYE
jgi:hypothetical protein